MPAAYLRGPFVISIQFIAVWGVGLESENVVVAISVDSQKQTHQENL